MSSVHLQRLVDCPFSEAFDSIEAFAASCNRERNALLRAPSLSGWIPLPGAARIAARPDLTEPGKPHDELLLSLRSFTLGAAIDLVLRFRIARLQTRVLLDAWYRPYRGRVGTSLAHTIGGRYLRSILEDFLARAAAAAEERERRYRNAHPPVLGPFATTTATEAPARLSLR